MMPFEEELRQALRRQEPAGDFTARVLAHCAQHDAKRRAVWWSFRALPAWAAALLLVAGGTIYQRHEREVRGLEAKRKLLLAVRIAGTKLQEVRERVRQSGDQPQ